MKKEVIITLTWTGRLRALFTGKVVLGQHLVNYMVARMHAFDGDDE